MQETRPAAGHPPWSSSELGSAMSAVAFRGSTGSTVRDLTDRDLPAVRELLDRDPIADVFVSSRIAACGLDPRRLGANVWGYERAGHLSAICYSGANLWPVQTDAEAARGLCRPGPQAGPPLLVHRRAARMRCSSCGITSPDPGGRPGRSATGSRCLRSTTDRRSRSDPGSPSGAARRAGRAAACLHRDVHRGDRCAPGHWRRRRAVSRAGRRDHRSGSLARPDRQRPGAVQGRDRRGDRSCLPDPRSLGGSAAAQRRPRRGRDGRGRRRVPADRSPLSSASTSTTSTCRPVGSTSGSASSRSAPSRRSFSETPRRGSQPKRPCT